MYLLIYLFKKKTVPDMRGAQRTQLQQSTDSLMPKSSECPVNKQNHLQLASRVKVKVTQSCPTLYDCIVHGILQARILEWVGFPFSRGSSQPGDQTQVSLIASRFFTA